MKTDSLFNKIRARSMVTIITPQGIKIKGRAVMKGPYGWVLNLGGRHGTPGIASEENIIAVRECEYLTYPLNDAI